MSDRCCGIFPLNTGLRVLLIVHIILCILLIADPWSTPFTRAVVLCESYPSDTSDKTWIDYPSSFKHSLAVSDLIFGIVGFVSSALVIFRIESKYFLLLLTSYFVAFAIDRCFWAFYVGFSSQAESSIKDHWSVAVVDLDSQAILDSCVSRLRRSAIVDALTTLIIYLYFGSLAYRKLRTRDRSLEFSEMTISAGDQTVVEGRAVPTEQLLLLDLNVLGMNGRFFVGKPINQRVLGRLA